MSIRFCTGTSGAAQQSRPTVRFGWGDSLLRRRPKHPPLPSSVHPLKPSFRRRNPKLHAEKEPGGADSRSARVASALGFSIDLGGHVCCRHVVDNGKDTRVEVTL